MPNISEIVDSIGATESTAVGVWVDERIVFLELTDGCVVAERF